MLPLFVVDPVFVAHGGARRALLHDCLAALGEATGGALVIGTATRSRSWRRSPPRSTPTRCSSRRTSARTAGVATPRSRARLARRGSVAARGRFAVRRRTRDGSTKDDGTPYAVFTPFSKGWRADRLGRADRRTRRPGMGRGVDRALPDRPDREFDDPRARPRRRCCPLAARSVDERLDRVRRRPQPARPSTGPASLSPFLKYGVLHPRQLLADLGSAARRPRRCSRSELAWRDFYADVLFRRPRDGVAEPRSADGRACRSTPTIAARARFDGVGRGPHRLPDRRRRHAPAARDRLDAQPGADDRGQLPREGPPPAMAVGRPALHGAPASTATWRRTATAGSGRPARGTDAAPYFRVFNPTAQARAVRPRRRVRGRAGCPSSRRRRYPAPMVDHAAERDEALARYAGQARAALARR